MSRIPPTAIGQQMYAAGITPGEIRSFLPHVTAPYLSQVIWGKRPDPKLTAAIQKILEEHFVIPFTPEDLFL